MILGFPALMLNFLAIAVFAVPLSAAILFILQNRLPGLAQVSAPQRRRLLWLIVLMPWLLAAVSTLLSLVPNYSEVLAANIEFLFWHHSTDFPIFSWHGLTVAMLLAALALVLVRGLQVLQRLHKRLRVLDLFTEKTEDAWSLVQNNQRTVFTAGFFKPRCYMTRGLFDALSEQERNVVLQHEQAHARHFDPLKKWFFSLACAIYTPAVARTLQTQMSLAMEQHADEVAAANIDDNKLVAMTLLKVRRLGVVAPAEQGAMCYFTADSLEQRIHALLGQVQSQRFPLAPVLLLSLAMLLLSTAFTDYLHHGIELLLAI